MKRSKYYCLGIAVTVVVLIAVIVSGCIISKREKATNAYNAITSVLVDFPKLKAPYANFTCYYWDGQTEYLLCVNGGRYITGIRGPDGVEIYYADDCKWRSHKSGKIENLGEASDEVSDRISEAIFDLLDVEVSLSYHISNTPDLPKWVYPDDLFYIKRTCDQYKDRMDVMTHGTEEGHCYIRWTITDLDICVLHLNAFENAIPYEKLVDTFFRDWGKLPDEIIQRLTEEMHIHKNES